MTAPNCREVRTYLSGLASGAASVAPSAPVWETLSVHGAVSGSPERPELTPVGRHVLSELEVRAYRTDASPLPEVAQMLTWILAEFDEVAKTAEYFLADLGPVTPAQAVPLLRPVSLGLANRRETPEELAEQFRNVWGSVEVMGGDPRDRLLAAELLNAASAEMSKVFSPIMNTAQRIREKAGNSASSVTPSTILHLAAGVDQPIPLDSYFALRGDAGSDEAAAMLAAIFPGPREAVAARDALITGFGTSSKTTDALHAATFLAAIGGDADAVKRSRELAAALGNRLTDPLTSSALLSTHARLSAAETVNWFDKAVEILTARQMAPSPREISALATALVHGFPESEFFNPPAPGQRPSAGPVSLPALTAIHAWVYRPLVGALGAVSAPAATPGA